MCHPLLPGGIFGYTDRSRTSTIPSITVVSASLLLISGRM
jgi:hypothetical protein